MTDTDSRPAVVDQVEPRVMRHFFEATLESGAVARFQFCGLVDVEKAKMAVEAACDVMDGPVIYTPPRGLFDALRRWWRWPNAA